MNRFSKVLAITSTFALTGCAGLVFNPAEEPDALSYFEPEPYFLVTTALDSATKNCVTTATVVVVPGAKRSVSLRSGYGSADLSVSLSNGMITSVGQKTDTKIPETITAISGLATAVHALSEKRGAAPSGCPHRATLYPIRRGIPDRKHPIRFPT